MPLRMADRSRRCALGAISLPGWSPRRVAWRDRRELSLAAGESSTIVRRLRMTAHAWIRGRRKAGAGAGRRRRPTLLQGPADRSRCAGPVMGENRGRLMPPGLERRGGEGGRVLGSSRPGHEMVSVFRERNVSREALASVVLSNEAAKDPDQLFAHRFKQANYLSHLKRYHEAAALLPVVQEMVERQGAALNRVRVMWLTARIAAGLGRGEEAEAGFQQVRREFHARDLPYEAALASLELAVQWLEAGRTAEVRGLAVEMEKVFKKKKIAREALAAVILFREAARREAATVELARRVIDEIEAARRVGGRG